MLYQKSMQALDLLLQNFVSENKSMDEICFLLQVRLADGVGRGVRGSQCPLQSWPWTLQGPLRVGPSHKGAAKRARLGGSPYTTAPSAPGAFSSCEGCAGCFRRAKDPARSRVTH